MNYFLYVRGPYRRRPRRGPQAGPRPRPSPSHCPSGTPQTRGRAHNPLTAIGWHRPARLPPTLPSSPAIGWHRHPRRRALHFLLVPPPALWPAVTLAAVPGCSGAPLWGVVFLPAAVSCRLLPLRPARPPWLPSGQRRRPPRVHFAPPLPLRCGCLRLLQGLCWRARRPIVWVLACRPPGRCRPSPTGGCRPPRSWCGPWRPLIT